MLNKSNVKKISLCIAGLLKTSLLYTQRSSESTECKVVKKGTAFSIVLPSNKSTGYSWRLKKNSDEANIKFIKSSYEKNKANALGAPGKEYWYFKAAQKGEAFLYFEYLRPFELDKPAAKIYTVKIIIK